MTLTGCTANSSITVYKLGNSNRRLMTCNITLSSSLAANSTLVIGKTTQKPMAFYTTAHAANLAGGKWYSGAISIDPSNGNITLVNEAPVGSVFYTGLTVYYNV